MSEKHRLLMIGAGGMAGHWIRQFLPPERPTWEGHQAMLAAGIG